jgi:hypothetical protein
MWSSQIQDNWRIQGEVGMMVWKCPKCSFTSKSYTAMQRHYYSKHHTPKAGSVSKGKDKKKHIFRPTIHRRK